MNGFINAMTTDNITTENGMPTNSTSSSNLLDLFYTIGASRSLSESEIVRIFRAAWDENPRITRWIMMYNRDVRGGQGERRSFRIMLKEMANLVKLSDPEYNVVLSFIQKVPKYGRWDDLFALIDTPYQSYALSLIMDALYKGDKLCAKWMPREGKAHHDWYKSLIGFIGITPKQYRKLLASCTKVVENSMCKQAWDEIEFGKIPSVAHNKYRKAFIKRCGTRYVEYIEAVKNGTQKINAGAIFPHDITKKIANSIDWNYSKMSATERNSVQAMWKALPDFVNEGVEFLPVIDVSGSMSGLPMQVAIALGLYLSERNKTIFKNCFISFSANPKFFKVTGDIVDKYVQVLTSEAGFNTDVKKVMELILTTALGNNVPQSDMPKYLIFLSDMQFDEANNEYASNNMSKASKYSPSIVKLIKDMYYQAGYKVPQIIFWNLRASSGIPVKMDERGFAEVSGFSPSLMKSILGESFTPLEMMYTILKKYESIL